MIVLKRLIVIAALFTCSQLRAEPFTAFSDGERLVYKVSWGFLGAGEIEMMAKAETGPDGKQLMRITNTIASKGLVRGMYRFDNKAEVLIERDTDRMLWVAEKGMERSKPTESRTDFDYSAKIAHHKDTYRPNRSRDIPLPSDAEPIDLLSALVQTRHWNIKVGDARDLLVYFGRDLYSITIRAEGVEEVDTPLGDFQALVLTPRMEKQPPQGVFKKGEIKVWIAQSGDRLPVKMKLQLGFGTATLTLIEHTVPKPQPTK
ncbi:MAG: DUF3108 domain-containing protein [Nibricoccus sp.]